jgi:hypothetical protein
MKNLVSFRCRLPIVCLAQFDAELDANQKLLPTLCLAQLGEDLSAMQGLSANISGECLAGHAERLCQIRGKLSGEELVVST